MLYLEKHIIRLSEILALQAYGQQMQAMQNKLFELDVKIMDSDKRNDWIESIETVSEQLDKVTNRLRKLAFPVEHLWSVNMILNLHNIVVSVIVLLLIV